MLELEENAFQNIIKSQKVIIKVQGLLKMISSYVSYYYPHKNLRINVVSSFIHNCYNLKAIKVSFSRYMGSNTVAHPEKGLLISIKKA